MTAQEARDKAKKVNTDASNTQMFKVRNAIGNAVDKGDYLVNIYFSINKDVQDALKEEGYLLNLQHDRNESFTTISW